MTTQFVTSLTLANARVGLTDGTKVRGRAVAADGRLTVTNRRTGETVAEVDYDDPIAMTKSGKVWEFTTAEGVVTCVKACNCGG